ncbi:hypothetical protein ACVW1C_002273 [Bradyrhizobium sp. USDA 4011]
MLAANSTSLRAALQGWRKVVQQTASILSDPWATKQKVDCAFQTIVITNSRPS